jgi:putative endonuclease
MGDDPRRRLGALGERLAARHLAARGYEVLERNFRTRHGELDIVAAGGRCLVFCEVKTRVRRGAGGVIGPFASIGPAKRRRLRAMAREWLAQPQRARAGTWSDEIRFDAIGVTLSRDGRLLALEHLEGAF